MEEKRITIGTWVNVAPATTSVVDFYRVPGGYKFTVRKVQVNFPAGTAGELALAFLVGPDQVLPTVGSYFGDGGTIVDETDITIAEDMTIALKASNANTTTARSAAILMSGILRR